MANATDNRNYGGDGAFAQTPPKVYDHKVGAAVEIFAGTFAAVLLGDADLPIVPLTLDGTTEFRGICTQHVNNLTGAKGDARARVSCEVGKFQNAAASIDACTAAHLMQPVYALDNQTVANNDGGGARPCVGMLVGFNGSDGLPMVWADATYAKLMMTATSPDRPTVRYSTTAALAANTYANGTGGLGATLTANANGALAAIDGQTPAIGDKVLVQFEATAANNGIYVVTNLGSSTTAWVLTRDPDHATNALLAGSQVLVQQGTQYGGMLFELPLSAQGITVGTTALNWQRLDTLAPVVVTFSATPTFSRAKSQQITMTANITGWTMPTGVADEEITIFFIQDGTGSRTLAGTPANVRLAGNALTLSTGANKVDCLTFKWEASLGTPAWIEKSRSLNC